MSSAHDQAAMAAITGQTAQDIAYSIRNLVDAGRLAPGAKLPPVRELAARLEVNRNTVVTAYGILVQAAVAETRGRAGTRIAEVTMGPQEGAAPQATHEGRDGSPVVDVGSGNPDPDLLPPLAPALRQMADREPPVLYGHGTLDPLLAEWVQDHFAEQISDEFRPTVVAGSSDAIERLLRLSLIAGDAVGFENPCFLTTINIATAAGYQPVAIPVDDEGMTVHGLQAALDAGARAVVVTPRAHNPTGVGLTAERAQALREVFEAHPHVLIIVDDHFWLLASTPYHRVIPDGHPRWALIRSVSKALGPDLRCAVMATDPATAHRLSSSVNSGSSWVSHILQRLSYLLVTDSATQDLLERASAQYRERAETFARMVGLPRIRTADGLNVWLPVAPSAPPVRDLVAALAKRGWRVRGGDEFQLTTSIEPGDATQPGQQFLRLTVHQLTDEQMGALVDDLRAVGAV